MESIELPDSITSIGEYAFYKCINLVNISFPSELTTIERYAFGLCHKIKSVDLPNIQSIADYGFSYCKNLEEISFGKNFVIDSNSYSTFNGIFKCPKLRSISVSNDNPKLSVYENVIYTKDYTDILYAPSTLSEIKFHDNLKTIKDNQFLNNKQITSVILNQNLNEINSNSFCGCINLKSVIFSKSLKSIGYNAFSGCINLESDILLSETSISLLDDYSFSMCKKIKHVSSKFIM